MQLHFRSMWCPGGCRDRRDLPLQPREGASPVAPPFRLLASKTITEQIISVVGVTQWVTSSQQFNDISVEEKGNCPKLQQLRTWVWRQVVFSYSDFCPREATHSFKSSPCPPTLGLVPLSHDSGHQLWAGLGCIIPEEEGPHIRGAQLGHQSGRSYGLENWSLALCPGLRLSIDRSPWVDPLSVPSTCCQTSAMSNQRS